MLQQLLNFPRLVRRCGLFPRLWMARDLLKDARGRREWPVGYWNSLVVASRRCVAVYARRSQLHRRCVIRLASVRGPCVAAQEGPEMTVAEPAYVVNILVLSWPPRVCTCTRVPYTRCSARTKSVNFAPCEAQMNRDKSGILPSTFFESEEDWLLYNNKQFNQLAGQNRDIRNLSILLALGNINIWNDKYIK